LLRQESSCLEIPLKYNSRRPGGARFAAPWDWNARWEVVPHSSFVWIGTPIIPIIPASVVPIAIIVGDIEVGRRPPAVIAKLTFEAFSETT
jgi:hypothetical protein